MYKITLHNDMHIYFYYQGYFLLLYGNRQDINYPKIKDYTEGAMYRLMSE